jgi:hypothetical protein
VKSRILLLAIGLVWLVACGPTGTDQVPVNELPDPAIYAINVSELPDVGLPWQQSYDQSTVQENNRWSYRAYQAYQPGNLGVELESAFAVNNDIILYEVDMRRADLPQPPLALGNIQNISWKTVSQSHKLGDKSAVWKTTIGELFTPVWWLEFYLGHAYVRISLLGFPDQVAPSILYGLGDIVVERLPSSVSSLRSDAATVIATPLPIPTSTPVNPPPSTVPTRQVTPTLLVLNVSIPVLRYTAPPGETGMVAFADETGNQLTDGITGSDDLLADLGSGTAYEWVGWTDQTDPITLTFTLETKAEISAVQIGINHREGLGVFVPSSVTINGKSFNLAAGGVPNNKRQFLSFAGPFQGPEVEIVLHHRGRGWIMVDEVRFLPNP